MNTEQGMTKDEVNTEHRIMNLSARLTATGSQADKESAAADEFRSEI